MKSFRQFTEEAKKSVAITFGRFSPPTIGHEKLLDAVGKAAKGGQYRIYASQSEDSKKNPLPYTAKVKFMRKMFPKHARNILIDRGVKTIFDAANKAWEDGYTKLVVVVGGDRIPEFKKRLLPYNGKPDAKGKLNYDFKDGIEFVSAGKRDPDAEGVEGMSASKMRAAAKDKDIKKFASGLPKGFGEVQELLNAVRKGMGLNESRSFRQHVALPTLSSKREKYAAGEIFLEGSTVLHTIEQRQMTVKERKTNSVICLDEDGKEQNYWLDILDEVV